MPVVMAVMYALMVMGLITIYGAGAHWYSHCGHGGNIARWTALGCYKDSPDRAMKYFLGHAKNARNKKQLYRKCRKMAENRGFDYFGIQNRVDCWGSNRSTYDKHGCSKKCAISFTKYGKRGMGKKWANFVYYKKPVWTECNGDTAKKYRLVVRRDRRPNCPFYNWKVFRGTRCAKKCKTKISCPDKIDGGWSKFGPWTACDQLCGDGGKQSKTRTCTNPKPANGGKKCEGEAKEYLDCNAKNCPTPCSFDGLLVQLLNNLNPGVTANNHLVTALSQVVRTIDAAHTSSDTNLNKDQLIDRLKAGIKHKGGEEQARTLLGLILAQKKDCKYAKVVKEIQKEIGDDAFKKVINADGKVTLTFTIDETASMIPVINEAKAIAKAIAGYSRESSVDYVLSTFGEMSGNLTGSVQTFEKLDDFVKAIDKIEPHAGGDCPEPTFAGIIKGIDKGHPKLGSPMYVFTDAPPKRFKGYTRDRAIGSAKASQIPINFFLTERTGSCRPQDSSDYKAIIKATGGVGLSFINAKDMEKLQPMFEADLVGTTIVTSVSCRNYESSISKRTIVEEEFIISDIDTAITVFASGTSNVMNGVTLFNSGRKEFHPDNYNGNKSKTWIILHPTVGKWILKFVDVLNHAMTVKTSSDVDITFQPTFYKNGHLISNPLIGQNAEAKIEIPHKSRLNASSLNFHLVGSNEIKSMTKNGEKYESELPDASGEAFKIRMKGKTLSGYDFQRESSINIHPKYVAISLSTVQLDLGIEKILTRAIYYSGTGSKTFTITVTTDPSQITAVAPDPVSVNSGGTAEFQVTLTGKEKTKYSGFPVTIEVKSRELVISLELEINVY